MKGIDLSKHACLKHSQDIKDSCKPLQLLGINSFAMHRIYKDNSLNLYTTRPDWAEFYYKKAYYEHALINTNKVAGDVVLWSALPRGPVWQDAIEYQIYDGITLAYDNLQYHDFYHFGASKSGPSDAYLIKIIPLLRKFISYFLEKMHRLIRTTAEEKIILPQKSDFVCKESFEYIQFKESDSVQKFIQLTEIKKFNLGEKFKNYHLTKKEIECIKLLNQTHSAAELGNKLNLSRRTIEVHITHIKKKLGCKTLYQLGRMLARNKFLEALLEG